ncbi:MAG: hypothetical protein J3K34DRAFT_489458 [Monoraphidium minutum]|nr:MAG: hypothetical protein J3K34DRAFT_489458 [Monoraphidium minutum]
MGPQCEYAVRACPFLKALADREGPSFAGSIALDPTRPARGSGPLLEDEDSLLHQFSLFHGPQGVCPLGSGAPGGGGGEAAGGRGPKPGSGSGGGGGSNKGGGGPAARRGPAAAGAGGASAGAAGASAAGAGAAGASAAASACPMRKWLGPMAGLVFNSYGKLQCPEPIIAARAALARTAPVRQLRPQALPLKLVAVAATAAALNVPCGAWREHFEKFSFGWFVAVHATIPFVAMLRKAVVMPKLAIVVTIAAAIAGQVVGSRLERARLAAEAARAAAPPAPAKPAGRARGAARSAPARPAAGAAAADAAEGLLPQLSCAFASMTQRPGSGSAMPLPVSPLKV